MYEPLKERMNNGAKAQQPPKAAAAAAAAVVAAAAQHRGAAQRSAYGEHDYGSVGSGLRRRAN